MVCLIKSKYQKELKEYADILGSESAAYYVLACNNGYTLDYDQNGKPSRLFHALLEINGWDENRAILDKAMAFTPQFTDKFGTWYEGQTEPSLVDLNDGKPLTDQSAIAELFGREGQFEENIAVLQSENILERDIPIKQTIDASRHIFVDAYIQDMLEQHPGLSAAELAVYKNQANIVFDEEKMKEILGKTQMQLADKFGLIIQYDENGVPYFIHPRQRELLAKQNKDLQLSEDDDRSYLTEEEQTILCRIQFVNSLRAEDYELPDGTIIKGVLNSEHGDQFTIHTIYISMMDGDATTMVHELAHHYIRQWWNTDLIQNGLRAFDPQNKLTGEQAAEKLVGYITDKVLSDNATKEQKNWVNTFWQKFNNMIRRALGAPLKNYNDRTTFLDSISAFFTVNADLSDRKTEELFYTLTSGIDFQSTIPKDKQLGSTFERIKTVLQNRIEAERRKMNADIVSKSALEHLKHKFDITDTTNDQEMVDRIMDFLNIAFDEMTQAIRVITNIKLNGPQNIDANQLMDLKYNVVGYYKNLFVGDNKTKDVSLQGLISNNEGTVRQLIESPNGVRQNVQFLSHTLTTLKANFDSVLQDYIDYQIDVYAEYLVDSGPIEVFKTNAHQWVRNQIDEGKLDPFDAVLGAAVNSKSPIVRLVDYMMREANWNIHQKSVTRGNRLYKLYEACKPKMSFSNFMRKFCEQITVDEKSGITSGNFVREENWGQMNYDICKFQLKLYKKYKHLGVRVLDRNGDEIDPEDIYLNGDTRWNWDYTNCVDQRKVYNDLNDELDDFLEDQGKVHRRYTAEYYKLRRRSLSQDTIDELNEIQKQIDAILIFATDPDTKVVNISQLSATNKAKLEELQRAKDELGSIYHTERDHLGNITLFEKKTGDELRMAEEIMNWRSVLYKNIKYYSNTTKFAEDRQKLVNKFGVNSREVVDFDYHFSALQISQDFWDQFSGTGIDTYELRQRRQSIVNTILPKKGFYTPHLEKLTDEQWAELKLIDEELSRIGNQSGSGPKLTDVADFQLYGSYDQSNALDVQNKYLNKLKQQYNQLAQTQGPQAIQDFYDKYYYTDDRGKLRPLSIFSYIVPKDQSYVKTLPIGKYIELDRYSPFADPEFDNTIQSPLQPDKKYYHNQQWDFINSNKNIRRFYEGLISTMEYAYQGIPGYKPEIDKFKLPQVRDSAARLAFQKSGNLMRTLKGIATDEFWISERDIDYNFDFAERADGTRVSTVPIRWAKRLDDPTVISTDVLMTVTMFYQMANAYKEKTQLAPTAEAILFELRGGFEHGNEDGTGWRSQASRVEKYIDMYLYERKNAGFTDRGSTKRASKTEAIISKNLKRIQSKSHSKLMAHNWRTVLKNLIDSSWNFFTELYGGKYINFKNFKRSSKILVLDFPKALMAAGNPQSKGFKNTSSVIAAMQFNELSGSVQEIFKGQRSSFFRRFYDKFFTMGEYTLVDFMFKGAIMTTVYQSYRLVTNPNTGKQEFMNQEQARYAWSQAGLSAKDGDKTWEKSNISLWDAYEVSKLGNWTLKKQYEDIVRPFVKDLGRRSMKIETRVKGTVKERAAYINGMMDDMDRNAVAQNYLGAMLLQMRGWQVSHGSDLYIKHGQDFATRDENTGEVTESDEFRGFYNFATGQTEYAVFSDLWRRSFWTKVFSSNIFKPLFSRYNSKFTPNEIYHIRRTFLPFVALAITMGSSFIFGHLLEEAYGDDDEWIWDILYTVSVSSTIERAGQIPFLSISTLQDIMTAPFVAKSWMDDIKHIFSLIYDVGEFALDTTVGIENPEYNEEIKQGSYKGQPKYVKDALKTMSVIIPDYSIDNIFRNLNGNGNVSSRNFYKKMFPANTPLVYKVKTKTEMKQNSNNSISRKSSRTSGRTRSSRR